MCKYCDWKYATWYDETSDNGGDGFAVNIVTSKKYEPVLAIEYLMDNECIHDHIYIPIHYCPVCGRKLD